MTAPAVGKKTALGLGLAAVLALAAPLIAKWEGVRYLPYKDVVGVWTVCFGHTKHVDPGREYTRQECKALLEEDMLDAHRFVKRCIRVPMKPHQEAALLSAAFNLGPGVVCGSDLQTFANAGDWAEACRQLSRWKFAGGRVYRGLVLRRADERAMCEGRES